MGHDSFKELGKFSYFINVQMMNSGKKREGCCFPNFSILESNALTVTL